MLMHSPARLMLFCFCQSQFVSGFSSSCTSCVHCGLYRLPSGLNGSEATIVLPSGSALGAFATDWKYTFVRSRSQCPIATYESGLA